MRIRHLTLLSFLLLALQEILVEGQREARNRHSSKAKTDGIQTPDKTLMEHRSRSQKRMPKGKFVTPDQAACRWAVTEQEKGIALKVECAREDNRFSCVFTGNPTACLELNPKRAYWKQIRRTLHSQNAICEDSKSALKTKVCRKNFPESSLKLVNSTLIRATPSSQEHRVSSPREQTMITKVTTMEPSRAKLVPTKMQTKVKNSTPSKAAGTQPSPTNDPRCLEDPDIVAQNMALEYCGETWSSLCQFFIAMIQSTSC